MKKRKKSENGKTNARFYCLIKGFIFSAVSFLVLMSAFALIITKVDFTHTQIRICAVLCCCIASFIGGFASTRKERRKGIVLGALSSIPLIFTVFLLALAVSGGEMGLFFLAVIPATVLSGCAGGILAANLRKN